MGTDEETVVPVVTNRPGEVGLWGGGCVFIIVVLRLGGVAAGVGAEACPLRRKGGGGAGG